ncbi:hypothetical protein TNCV_3520331 [Trichonephila clavipes]|nr:hypothetical protein TNCV_3520331 [Trichonephila clavipes]
MIIRRKTMEFVSKLLLEEQKNSSSTGPTGQYYRLLGFCDFEQFLKRKMILKGSNFQSRDKKGQNKTAELNTISNKAFYKCCGRNRV